MRELVNETVYDRIEMLAKEYPDKTALWQGECKVSYASLHRLTDMLACGFLKEGVTTGSHVAIWGEPDAKLLLTFIALQKIGCVTVMINTCLKYQEVACQLEVTDSEYLILGDCYKDVDPITDYEQMDPKTKNQIKKAFYVGACKDCSHTVYDELLMINNYKYWASKLQKIKDSLSTDRPALMLSTSGTTGGKPKYVVLSMFHLVNGGLQKAEVLKMNVNDIVCQAMPLFHIFCLDVNVMAALMTGACLYLPNGRRSRQVLQSVQDAKCTVLSAVPSIFYSLVARQDELAYDLSSLRCGMIGGAYCPPEKFCEIEEKFGFTLIPGLGQTEAAAGIAIAELTDSLELRSHSVGHIVNHMEAKIIDPETGDMLPQGEAGELCIRGDMLMMGYYKAEELTAAAFDENGFMHTGDVAFFDENGYLYMKARIKDMINRGGEKINPNEIESYLLADHRIRACKVVPVPDAHYGEQACAVIELKKGVQLTKEELIESLKSQLADFKIPAYVIFTEHLFRTATGKYRQKDIISMAIEVIGQKAG